jgi:hypothetical protein
MLPTDGRVPRGRPESNVPRTEVDLGAATLITAEASRRRGLTLILRRYPSVAFVG